MFLSLIGPRILKTGIAVSVAIFISNLLKVEPVMFAAVSAVLNLQPSVYRSIKNAREQLLIHIAGVLVALLLGFTVGQNSLTMGIATILVISLCVKLKLKGSVAMGVVAAIFILNSPEEQFLTHATARSIVILIGLLVALVINALILPPKYKDEFFKKVKVLNEKCMGSFCVAMDSFVQLDKQKTAVWEEKKAGIHSLIAECKELMNRCREQADYKKILWGREDEELVFYEQYLNLNIELYYKADSIYTLIHQRLERREQGGNREISTEFCSILEKLMAGRKAVEKLNKELLQAVVAGEEEPKTLINETFWEQLNRSVSQWYQKFYGSYYLHAFMEVSVVAQELRWAAGEMQRLLKVAEKACLTGEELNVNYLSI